MKITIIGAAGVRTPLIIQAIQKRQQSLRISELSLMDIDAGRLKLIGELTSSFEHSADTQFHVTRTTDPEVALSNADYVITTFRVGGIESRAIDERVPLEHAILGQETTGPGGFAMGIRSIPVLLEYVEKMHELCPHAWLINFANPAGMLTEAVLRHGDWPRVVGICDGPATMHGLISAVLGALPADVQLDYFGLNHLGWIKRVNYHGRDHLPDLISLIKTLGRVPGLPFDPALVEALSMIPNEYLYYYYYTLQAVNNILQAGQCRGEQVAAENLQLFSDLQGKSIRQDYAGMQDIYRDYMHRRGSTYMVRETGRKHDFSGIDLPLSQAYFEEGYAGVALNLIEGLVGDTPTRQILNVASQASFPGMDALDVVEVPAEVSRGQIRPIPVSDVPSHAMGLIQQVKAYEHLTIEAAVELSYQKALLALAIHPLVRDYTTAQVILDEYINRHQGYFPQLH